MQQYQLVTAVHGNESLPTLALASIGMKQIVANPRALARGVRYLDSDLNASFGVKGALYEQKRARVLTRELDVRRPVIDFHTFSCVSEPFAIIVDLALLPLAASLGLKHVVYMQHNIKGGHALINHFPGVSVEVGEHSDPQSFARTLAIVRQLGRKGVYPHKVRVYAVYARIETCGQYINFTPTDDFVPVLYGERAYPVQGFYGLKAREITRDIAQGRDI